MNNLNKVEKEEFVNTVSKSWYMSKGHNRIAGGLVYVDRNDKIIGVTIASSNSNIEFYLAPEILAH